MITAGMTQGIDFFPGNFSAAYGRATGGITNIGLNQLEPERAGGYADINLFDTSIYLEAPIGEKLAVAVGGRRSYIDSVLQFALPNNGSGSVAPRYYDLQGLVRYRPSNAHQLTAFGMLSDDQFRLLFEEPVVADAETVVSDLGFFTKFSRGIAEYRFVPSERLENSLKVSYGEDRFNVNVGDGLGLNVAVGTGQLRDTLRYAWSDALALRVGLDYLYERSTGGGDLPDLPREGEGDSVPDLSNPLALDLSGRFHSTAGFAELELSPWSGSLLLPSVRVEHFSQTDSLAVSPRLTLRQQVSEEVALAAGVGHFVQTPEVEETAEGYGNPELGLKQSVHYSVGVEWRPADHLKFDLTAFYKTLYDQVARSDAAVERGGVLIPERLNNEGEGRVRGLELSLKHELHRGFFGWLAYTLSRSERLDPGSSDYRLFDFDQTHILTAMASYQLPRNWEVSTRFRYVSGNLFTPIVDAVYDADADAYDGILGRANSARIKAFHQADVRLDKRWIYDGWMLNAYLEVQNVYDRENEDEVEYNYDFTESSGSEGLPILPVVGLRGEF